MVASRIILALALLLAPSVVLAATIDAANSIEITESPTDNAYLAGSDIRISAPLPEDLLAAGGSLRVFAPIGGDVSLAGGTIDLTAPVAGDVRVIGGHITIQETVAGDLAALGSFVRVLGEPGEVNVAGGTVELLGGARGPVAAYGGTITLSGTFAGDVEVGASDRIVIAENTVITGSLEYNAPQEAVIPESAQIAGGVEYVGSASFLPSAEEAQAFAIAGVGIFLAVRILAGMLAAGLVTGLFPRLAASIRDRVLRSKLQGFIRVTVIGLATMVLTPLAIFLLLISFVGMGVAALLGVGFILILLLGHLFSAAVVGSMLSKTLFKRDTVLWSDGALGVLVLWIIGVFPVVGFLVAFVLTAASLGSLVSIFYEFAFRNNA